MDRMTIIQHESDIATPAASTMGRFMIKTFAIATPLVVAYSVGAKIIIDMYS